MKKHLLLITIVISALLGGCVSVPTASPKSSKQEIAEGIRVLEGFGFDVVSSPAVNAGSFGAFYSLEMAADYFGAKWTLTYSSSKDLGPSIQLSSNGFSTRADQSIYNTGLASVRVYTAEVPEAFFADAQSSGRVISLSGNNQVSFEIWPELAQAFYERSKPLANKWENPTPEFRSQLLAKAATNFSTQRDDYKKLYWFNGGEYQGAERNVKYELYARLEDGGDQYFWLKIASTRSYYQGWAFFRNAVDSDGNEFSLTRKSEVGYGGTTYEWLHIPLNKQYLEGKVTEGLDFKIYGDRASTIIQVPGWIVESFLLGIENFQNP